MPWPRSSHTLCWKRWEALIPLCILAVYCGGMQVMPALLWHLSLSQCLLYCPGAPPVCPQLGF
jgi:hypothetical protein